LNHQPIVQKVVHYYENHHPLEKSGEASTFCILIWLYWSTIICTFQL
jgi:hypothetical protein